jgi:hypothetical protein
MQSHGKMWTRMFKLCLKSQHITCFGMGWTKSIGWVNAVQTMNRAKRAMNQCCAATEHLDTS